MMTIEHELPEHVELSEHLREHAPFFLCVTLFGMPYYIAATPKIRQLLSLDSKGRDAKPDERRKWRSYDKGDALRDIISAIHLQVRDVVLAEIEENVTQVLLRKMKQAMSPTVRGLIDNELAQRASNAQLLVEGGDRAMARKKKSAVTSTKGGTDGTGAVTNLKGGKLPKGMGPTSKKKKIPGPAVKTPA